MGDSTLSQYTDLYLQTSKEYLQALNSALLTLEKQPDDEAAIEEIFRNAHTLKSQSAAMGFEQTGFLCHAVEDVFFEIKQGGMQVTPELADQLFEAFDGLTQSIAHIETEGAETDLSPLAEKLKELTGIQTVGAGKSQRTDSPAQSEPQTPVPQPQTPHKTKPHTSPPQHEDTKPEKPSPPASSPQQSKTIAVKVSLLDEMLDLLEELLIHQLSLKKLVRELENDDLRTYQDQIEKITAALEYQVLKIRAVPIKLIFDHFPRAVRDLARQEEKQIELIIEGDDLELDRTIVDRLDEPLIHIIRNAVSHGIDKSGTIRLSARREKDAAIVEIADNGMGVDWDAVAKKAQVDTTDPTALKKLLFSGLSTSETVTQVSGRGVGLQVVKKTIEDFGGSIDVLSETGKGTTFVLRLPLTLAVAKALLVQVGSERYVIPASAVDRSLELATSELKKTANQEAFVLEESEVPLIRLNERFSLPSANAERDGAIVVVVSVGNERIGLVVDALLEATEVIMKPVPEVLAGNSSFAGVTILDDGQSALIVNPQGLML